MFSYFQTDWKLVLLILGGLLLSLEWVGAVEGPGALNDLPGFEPYVPEKKQDVPILLGERRKLNTTKKLYIFSKRARQVPVSRPLYVTDKSQKGVRLR